jgi:hypothetical protein
VEIEPAARQEKARRSIPTGSPLTGGADQSYMIAQNSTTATTCDRRVLPVASLHSLSAVSTVATALCGLALVLLVAIAPALGQQASAVGTVTHDSSVDAIKVVIPAAKRKPAIIAKSDAEFSLTFSNCRENEKQHVSCQFTDPAGVEHWVYLPGIALSGSK